ncbi:MAG: YciI family protein [Burkholderiaceae bacterium]
MSYLLLIVEPAGQRQERGREAGEAVFQEMQDFAAELQARGVLQGVNSLASAGTRLQLRAGKRRVVDGPFAEAKELVGGYFLVDVATRDEALAIAAECPAATWATVEVREVGPCFL